MIQEIVTMPEKLLFRLKDFNNELRSNIHNTE